jgi:FkbM family methyltransferase
MSRVSALNKTYFFLGRFLACIEEYFPLDSVVIPYGGCRFVVPRRWIRASLSNLSHIYVLRDYERVPCLTCLKPGSAVLDLGAFVGFFSVKVARENRGVRVCAVEANPFACRYLYVNLALNGVRGAGVLCGAVGEKRGFSGFYAADNGVNSSLIPGYVDSSAGGFEPIRVGVFTLGEVFERFSLENVSLVKMDIEGVEERVLFSSRELVSPDCVERWIIEVHPPYSSPGRIVSLLEQDYRVATFFDYEVPGQLFVYAWAKR